MNNSSWAQRKNYSFAGQGLSRRRTESFQRSSRKPIFQFGFSDSKLPVRSTHHITQVIRDDFCGCQHNLEPCVRVKALLKGVSQSQMRKEYEAVESAGKRISRAELRIKYFRFLPAEFPELFHTQLSGLISSLDRDIQLNQFLGLAWIQFHSKLEHIAYFLHCDLRKSQRGFAHFKHALDLALIQRESSLDAQLQSAKQKGLPLAAFLEDYYDSVAASFVPLAHYARLLSLLLQKGIKILVDLAAHLLIQRRDSLLEVLSRGTKGAQLREASRSLNWEQYLEAIEGKS